MDYLPLFFDLRGKACLIVGGGAVALRKADLLHRAGAQLVVVAPEIRSDLLALVEESQGQGIQRNVEKRDIQGKRLVIAASDDMAVNEAVSHWAKVLDVPVNVVDAPEHSSVIFGAIIDRAPLQIAVSSGGGSPVLARWVRSLIESLIPAHLGKLAHFMSAQRDRVKAQIPDMQTRRLFWESIPNSVLAEKIMAGDSAGSERLFAEKLNQVQRTQGEVALIGAGPGDPELLTFKALRLLQAADVVLYDRLVNPLIVDMARRDAEKIYVGKARSLHSVPQGEINQLLIDHAKAGKKVVRLKGGDPFIFGRGGEEIEGLAAENIPFQVVPGITAASGCASYAGIPLTHRDYAQSVRFVTGHLKDDSCDLNWSELIHADQTLVFYMGLTGLAQICKRLMEHGRAPSTPIALVQKGTTPEQRVFTGTLADLPARIAKEEVHAPTLIIVGEVVQLHDTLSWYQPEYKGENHGI